MVKKKNTFINLIKDFLSEKKELLFWIIWGGFVIYKNYSIYSSAEDRIYCFALTIIFLIIEIIFLKNKLREEERNSEAFREALNEQVKNHNKEIGL